MKRIFGIIILVLLLPTAFGLFALVSNESFMVGALLGVVVDLIFGAILLADKLLS